MQLHRILSRKEHVCANDEFSVTWIIGLFILGDVDIHEIVEFGLASLKVKLKPNRKGIKYPFLVEKNF
jgi:hypothetical protein